MKRCKKCAHYTPDSTRCGGFGACSKMGDANDVWNMNDDFPKDRALGWDFESYSAGVYVGENFGCIHWMKIESAEKGKP